MNPQLQLMLQKAMQALEDGNFDGADSVLRAILQNDRNTADTIFELGIACTQENKFSEAIAIFRCLDSLNTDILDISYNLGFLYAMQGNFECALESFDKANKLNPNDLDTLLNYASTLHELKRFDEAIVSYDKVLNLNADNEEVWHNKGNTLYELKRYDEAIAYYDKALSLKPDYAAGWSDKGIALSELKRYDEAIAHYDKALSLKPDYAEGWSNKGATLHHLKRYDEAIAHYDKALSLKPDYAEVWYNNANTLYELKRYDEAIAYYDRVLSLKPSINWAHGDLLHAKMKISNWSGLADSLEQASKKVMSNEKVAKPFSLLPLSDDALLHKQCAKIFTQAKYPSNTTLGFILKPSKKDKIRIAYFSPDFRNHPVSFLTSELFEIHDRGRFEVFAFSLQKALIGDETSLRLRNGFDRFIDVDDMSDREIAQLARDLDIDIAVDLAGPTQYSRTGIFSYRVAPIQVNWLGYPGTIGADFIDYIVADKIIIPESHQQFYAEKIVYLPNTYMVDDSKRTASSRVFTAEECGLPQNTFVFCCFNNDYKFNPQVLDSWSRILLTAKNSVLWISENNEYFKTNIATEFESRGIDADRIIFAQRVELMADHLSRYALADLFLDTYPYNAHTTALDSLKAGVPVLTLMGQSFPSRVAASLLNAINLPELITNTQEEYESLAIELAMNPEKLADAKLKLANNRLTTPLFDTPRFAKNLEAAYIKIYERYQLDLEPDHIAIT